MTDQPNNQRPDDDTEGHTTHWSDRDLKQDIDDVADDDTEGHQFLSDRGLKQDVDEIPDDDDAEGHDRRI